MTSVINPETGENLFPPEQGWSVTLHDPRPDWTPSPGEVCVAIKPSFRPGVEHDLTTYPAAWVTPSA